MELIRGLHNLRERHRGCVLSIGNFDGFHRGHQALVTRLKAHSERLKVPVAIQIFEPTPREFFTPESAPGRVATFRDKLRQLELAGVDRVLCVGFNRRFAGIPAQSFIEQVLVLRLGVKAIVVGSDFRFGAGRGGDLALLQQAGTLHGFTAEAVNTVEVDDERVSSTAVREALAEPDLARAARLLRRPYDLSGRVRRGLKLGRTLDMPTANIALKRKPALKLGVYVVQAEVEGRPSPVRRAGMPLRHSGTDPDSLSPQKQGEGGRSGLRPPELGKTRWMGVANVGVRPTVGLSPCLLEAHLFGEVGDLYGQVLSVRFLKFLRAEQRFDSMEVLKKQMQRDGEQARTWLKQFAFNP